MTPAKAAAMLLEKAIDKLRREPADFDGAADDIQNAATIADAVLGPPVELPAPGAESGGRVKIRIKTDDRNYKGKGAREYRLVVHKGRTYWADSSPIGVVAEGQVELPVGTTIIHIRSWFADSNTTKPKTTYEASLILRDAGDDADDGGRLAFQGDDECPVQHVGVKPGNVHVLEIKATKKRVEVKPAAVVVLIGAAVEAGDHLERDRRGR